MTRSTRRIASVSVDTVGEDVIRVRRRFVHAHDLEGGDGGDEEEVLFGPTPALATTVEIGYTIRVPGLSTGNQNTYLGDNAPDAILYGTLIEAIGYMKETPQTIELWQGYYNRAIQTLANEEQVRMRNDEFRNGELRTMQRGQ